MARIAGVNIPTGKRVVIALRYIYGIGPTNAAEICKKIGIPDAKRVNQLSDEEVLKIREYIDREHRVEGDLRREIAMNIKRLMDMGAYRGPHPDPSLRLPAYACRVPSPSCRRLRRPSARRRESTCGCP